MTTVVSLLQWTAAVSAPGHIRIVLGVFWGHKSNRKWNEKVFFLYDTYNNDSHRCDVSALTNTERILHKYVYMFYTLAPSSSSGVAVVELNGRLGGRVRKREVWVALATPTERRRRDGLKEQSNRNGRQNVSQMLLKSYVSIKSIPQGTTIKGPWSTQLKPSLFFTVQGGQWWVDFATMLKDKQRKSTQSTLVSRVDLCPFHRTSSKRCWSVWEFGWLLKCQSGPR